MKASVKALLGLGGIVAVQQTLHRRIWSNVDPLVSELGGSESWHETPYGTVFYTVRGEGPSLLLLHGIYAGASSFEWKEVFQPLSERFRVYAVDLLGFGKSDKPEGPYTADLMEAVIEDFVRHVAGCGTLAIANSLSAAWCLHLSAYHPELFGGLVVVNPTGLHTLADPPGERARRRYQLLSTPLLGEAFYDAVASHTSIRYYLQEKTFFNPRLVDDAMVRHYWTAAHQPGAEIGVRSFLSGVLNRSIADVLPQIRTSLGILWGAHNAFQDLLTEAEGFAKRAPRALSRVFENAGGLPQVEDPQSFTRFALDFFEAIPAIALSATEPQAWEESGL